MSESEELDYTTIHIKPKKVFTVRAHVLSIKKGEIKNYNKTIEEDCL